MIYILDNKFQKIQTEISKKYLYEAIHTKQKEDDIETFDGAAHKRYGEFLKDRNRIIIPQNGSYREFIITRTEQEDDTINFECNASYLELLKTARPIPPKKLDNVTLQEAIDFALQGTVFEPGLIEYHGEKDVTWTDYNSPYDVIKIICTAFKVKFSSRIEVGKHKVETRYIDMTKPEPLFYGKEVVRGKDLQGLVRSEDMSEVVTALFCLGPQDENGNRKTTMVYDNDAQDRWGLESDYIWDVYEPETENENMTLDRLTTLGKMELNKRNNSVVSYEITQLNLEHTHPHEHIEFGARIRIKDPDFSPPLYAESEVITHTRDLLNPSNSTYVIGDIQEQSVWKLKQRFSFIFTEVNRKLADNFNNMNTIVQLTDEKLEIYERKVIRSDTPPLNPINDMYWSDTSNPNAAILKRYFNGQWIDVKEEERNQIGGLTREITMYHSLVTSFENLSIQHQKISQEVLEVSNSEYLVDNALKLDVSTKMTSLGNIFNLIDNKLKGISENTASIVYMTDIILLFNTYKSKMQALYNTLETAKVAINERLSTLQKQFTEEKFNDAMKRVADAFGIQQDEQGRFIGPPETVAQMIDALKTETQEEMSTLLKRSEYETDKEGFVERLDAADSERKQLSDEISDRVTLTEFNSGIDSTKQYADNKVETLEIGNVNLICSYKTTQNIVNGIIEGDYAVRLPLSRNINFYYYDRNSYVNPPLESNTDYVLQLHEADADVDMGVFYNKGSYTVVPYSKERIIKFNTGDKTDFRIVIVARSDNQFVGKVSLYKGTKELDWTPNPLDVQTNIDNTETNAKAYADSLKRQQDEVLTTYDTRITQNGKDIEQRATKEEYNASKQLLDKTIAQVVTSAINGVSASYNDNGTISDIVLDNQGIALNSHLININEGDVAIQNGVTTIKDLVADKITSGILRSNDGGLVFDIDRNVMNVYESGAINFFTRGRISFNSGNSRLDIFQQNTSDGRNVLHMGGDLFAYGTGLTDPNREAFTGISIYPGFGANRYSAGRHIFTAGGTMGSVGFAMDFRDRSNTNMPAIYFRPYYDGGTLPNYYLGYNDSFLTGVYSQAFYGNKINDIELAKTSKGNTILWVGSWGILIGAGVQIVNKNGLVYAQLNNGWKWDGNSGTKKYISDY
ncbi:phage tail spike protein [Staphylococcus felis]|uniref:phage tail spike protein n=2 Tax=Staphylococcus felis TaxID=46127 RepID=UPI0015F29023|nr:phage tail spike protein [Staphylococcus felis]